MSVDTFVERVFDQSPKFPRRFSHDSGPVDGGGGGGTEAAQCAYLLPSSLDKIVDEDTMVREQDESDREPRVSPVNGAKGPVVRTVVTTCGGGKESGPRRRSTSGSPSSKWAGSV